MPSLTMVVEEERRRRIRLSVAAYAYEYYNHSIMTDSRFDELCKEVDTSIKTGNKKLDNFFFKKFDPATGMWVRTHPNKIGLENIYHRYFKEDK